MWGSWSHCSSQEAKRHQGCCAVCFSSPPFCSVQDSTPRAGAFHAQVAFLPHTKLPGNTLRGPWEVCLLQDSDSGTLAVKFKSNSRPDELLQTCNPGTLTQEDCCELRTRLSYTVSSRSAWATQQDTYQHWIFSVGPCLWIKIWK